MLAAALILDALVGEPAALWRRLPHPVVLMGRLVGWLDRTLNAGGGRRRKGVAAVVLLLAASLSLSLLIEGLPLGAVLSVLGGAILLAQRSLTDHVAAVAEALDRSVEDGRAAVSRIVGRDPQSLDRSGVARAAIESAAENFSDGVVAPAFWFAVGGLPGIVLYKAVNTADSMIGHRNERYRDFGWAAARLDDLLNWIPARMAGALICLAARNPEALRVMWRDARLHKSPNAGWPEAATAAVLGVALAGPRVYGGVVTDDPYVHPDGDRNAGPREIRAAVDLIWRAWVVLLGLSVLGGALRLVT